MMEVIVESAAVWIFEGGMDCGLARKVENEIVKYRCHGNDD